MLNDQSTQWTILNSTSGNEGTEHLWPRFHCKQPLYTWNKKKAGSHLIFSFITHKHYAKSLSFHLIKTVCFISDLFRNLSRHGEAKKHEICRPTVTGPYFLVPTLLLNDRGWRGTSPPSPYPPPIRSLPAITFFLGWIAGNRDGSTWNKETDGYKNKRQKSFLNLKS